MTYEGIPQIQQTTTACAGASTAYVIQHVAARCGFFGIGVQPQVVTDLGLYQHGATLDAVKWWLDRNRGLPGLGRLVFDLVAPKTDELLAAIENGRGRLGAVVGLEGAALYPGDFGGGKHAVSLVWATPGDAAHDTVVLIDPWPSKNRVVRAPGTLDEARRRAGNVALMVGGGR